MIVRLPRNFIFPLTTLAFVGITVEYTNIVFTTTTRWIFLAVLVIYLLVKKRFLAGFQSLFGVALVSYCAWCIITYTWSEVPDLSIAKALAFTVLAIAFVSAGQEWIHDRGERNALICLAPVTVVALFAGTGHSESSWTAAVGELAMGLTTNPNMLGSLVAMSLPLLLWSLYRYRKVPNKRIVFFALLVFAAVMLLRTYSRSAIMSAGFLALGFCLSLKLSRTTFIFALIACSLGIAAAAGTAIVNTTYNDYILKGVGEENGLWVDRQTNWQQSLAAAQVGGWFGAGYGVSVGDTSFRGGATAVGYGREKGNAQLAIVEETGLIGLALYTILLVTLFHRLISTHRREKNADKKVMLGIIIGALAGVTAMSMFEAWWVAPGSAESAYFWSLAGVGLGLTQRSAYRSKTLGSIPLVQQRSLYLAGMPQRRVKG